MIVFNIFKDSCNTSHADDDSNYHSHRHNDKNNAIVSDSYNCTISLSQRFCYVKKTQLIDSAAILHFHRREYTESALMAYDLYPYILYVWL